MSGSSFSNNSNSIGNGFSKYTKNSSQSLILLLFGSKAVRACCTILLYFMLQQYSLISTSFYLSLFSSIMFIVYEKPWTLISAGLRPSQIKKIVYLSLFAIFIQLTWNASIKYIGPTGSILASDYTHSTYPFLFKSILNANYLSADLLRAGGMLLAGYLAIPWFTPSAVSTTTTGYSTFMTFVMGIFFLVLHNLLNLAQRLMIKKWTNLGSKDKLHSLASGVSTIILFIFKTISDSNESNGYSSTSTSITMGQIILFIIISFSCIFYNYFIEAISEQQLGLLVLSKASLTATLLFSIITGLFIGYTFFHPILIISFIMILTGKYLNILI